MTNLPLSVLGERLVLYSMNKRIVEISVKTIAYNFGYTEINEDELIKLLEDEEIVT